MLKSLRRLLIALTIVIFIAIIIIVAIIYSQASLQIVQSLTTVDRHPQHDSPENHQLTHESVRFSPRHETFFLHGWYLPAPKPGPTIIFVHGLGDNRTGRERMRLAAELIHRNFNVLLFDSRAHGQSEGTAASGGFFEQYDVLGAIDFINQHHPPSCLGLLAASAGTPAAIMAAAQEPSVHGLVLDSPYASINELLIKEIEQKTDFPPPLIPLLLPGAKIAASLRNGISLNTLQPEKLVRDLSFPILVIHGLKDTRIPPEHSQRVHANSPPSSSLWLVNDASHVDSFLTSPDEFIDRVTTYFNQTC